jgi:hypothetical protein
MIALLPPEAYSLDLSRWKHVTDALGRGDNPYITTERLNYAPLWLQCLYFAHLISDWVSLSVHNLIQLFLTIGDALLIMMLWTVGRHFIKNSQLLTLLFWGFALNPTTLLLTVQHGNFDVLFMVFVLLALDRLHHAHKGCFTEPTNWLLACFLVGVGILTKTIPIVLIPLLCLGARDLEVRVLLFGGLLLFGPAAYGMSIIFSLAPVATMEKVLQYRGIPGYFGLSGALVMGNQVEILNAYIRLFPLFLFGLLAGLTGMLYFNKLNLPAFRDKVVFSTLALMFVPVFGSGYGPQYIMWFLPLLLLVYPGAHRYLRAAIVVFFVISLATFAVEYALLPSHGAFAINWLGIRDLIPTAISLYKRTNQFVLRLPMFICCLTLFVLLLDDLRRFAPLYSSKGKPEMMVELR